MAVAVAVCKVLTDMLGQPALEAALHLIAAQLVLEILLVREIVLEVLQVLVPVVVVVALVKVSIQVSLVPVVLADRAQ